SFAAGYIASLIVAAVLAAAAGVLIAVMLPRPTRKHLQVSSAAAESWRRVLFFSLRFPHSVRRKNIAKHSPPDHPRYADRIGQFHTHLRARGHKNSTEP